MTDEPSKIILKKNEDGSTTKVLVKKVTLKVKVKAPNAPEPVKPGVVTPEPVSNPVTSKPTNAPTVPPVQTVPTKPPHVGPVKGGLSDLKAPVRTYPPRPGGPRPGGGYGGGAPGGAPRGDGSGPPGGLGTVDPRKKKIFVARKKPGEGPRGPGGGPGAPTPPLVPANASQRGPHDRKKNDRYEPKEINKLSDKFLKRDEEQNEFANVPASIEIPEVISLKNLAMKLNLKVAQIIKKFFDLGVMDLTVNDSIDSDSASILCAELKCEVKVVSLLEQTKVEEERGKDEDYARRDPIVTVMGHVDHGKTSLLDAIRKTDVAAGESGGITQHIGAYKVSIPKGSVLFIDTPGHAAFSSMRSRGAKVTDIVILVVSAIDGVMPQTIEAINHAKAAGVPIIVAVNKMDVPGADATRIRTQLSEHGLVSEDWGGDTMFLPVSALKKTGLTELLEAVLLQAEMKDLKANPKVRASGYVIESKVEQGKGNVATVIIKNGTLKPGAAYLCGNFTGRVRAIFNDRGEEIKSALPSTPVEIIGLSGLPQAGDIFVEMESEREAKKVADRRLELVKENAAQNVKKITLSNIFDAMKQRQVKEHKVILKGDVFGSVEAIKELLNKQKNDEVKVTVIHSSTGAINETDVQLASASQALIIGFKVRPNPKAKKMAETEKVDVRLYQIIYDIIDDIAKVLLGMLDVEQKEEKLGSLRVKEVFKITGSGKIAGCVVTDGKVTSKARVRLFRDDVQIYEGEIATLKHYKDEVKEVLAGTECGIQIKDYQDLRVGDVVESYQLVKIERKLEISAS